MINNISDAVIKLSAITKEENVDWNHFDSALRGLDDINAYDDRFEETILSEFIMGGEFYNRGSILVETIRHFLACGYDVFANGGLNGGLALQSLCWSTYDQHILDAAKILMDAGAPVIFRTSDDDPGEEPAGLIGSIAWKLPGAWTIDKNYAFANTLEAFYCMAEAHIAGKDYSSIDHYFTCVGKPLTAVSAIKNGDVLSLQNEGGLSVYNEPIVMWFGDRSLVCSCYTDFVVNPLYAEDKKEELCDVTGEFSTIVGAELKAVRYIGPTICYLEFSNGQRLFFASRDVGDRKRVGTFKVLAKDIAVDIEHFKIESICGIDGTSFASHVTNYCEDAVALFCGDGEYALFLDSESDNKNRLCICSCSKELLGEYTRRYPLKNHSRVSSFYERDDLRAIRIDYPEGHLYIQVTEYGEIELHLADELYDPLTNSDLSHMEGKHIEFLKREE